MIPSVFGLDGMLGSPDANRELTDTILARTMRHYPC